MYRKILTGILILIVIGVLGLVGFIAWVFSAFGGFDKDYSVTDLKENFEDNKTEIYELKGFFNEIVPENRFVEIEFEDDNTLFRFGIKALDSTAGNPNGPMYLEWDLKTNTAKMDSLTNPMGWTRETLRSLKEKLDKANCIKIESGDPTRIGFKRSGLGMYSFNVFERPVPANMIENYNDSCRYIYVNRNLVLEYSGGAIGGQCFYNFK